MWTTGGGHTLSTGWLGMRAFTRVGFFSFLSLYAMDDDGEIPRNKFSSMLENPHVCALEDRICIVIDDRFIEVVNEVVNVQ